MSCARFAALGLAVAFVALLGGCLGGSGDAPNVSAGLSKAVAQAVSEHAPVFRIAEETLLLPTVRSGGTVYEKVKLQLAADGTWSLAGFEAMLQDRATDTEAMLVPARELGTLAASGERTELRLRRAYHGSRLLGATRNVLEGNRWSYAQTPADALALSAQDFADNPGLTANHRHVVALAAGSGGPTQDVPMQLHIGPFRLCAETGSRDVVTLLDVQGKELAKVVLLQEFIHTR